MNRAPQPIPPRDARAAEKRGVDKTPAALVESAAALGFVATNHAAAFARVTPAGVLHIWRAIDKTARRRRWRVAIVPSGTLAWSNLHWADTLPEAARIAAELETSWTGSLPA